MSAEVVKPTCVRVVKAMMLVLLLLPRRVVATTVSDELAYGSYSYCYDPAGVSCTCTGEMYLWTGYGDDSYGDDSYGASSYGLSGRIPAELSACIGLTVLDVEGSLLTGTLPAEFSALTGLTKLHLSQKKSVTGTLPAEWSALTTLKTLDLKNNRLTGTLPAEWSAMQSVRKLDLKNNRLAGTLPAEWAAAPNLNWLELQSNEVSGTLPPEYGAVSWSALGLWANKLTGDVPPSFCDIGEHEYSYGSASHCVLFAGASYSYGVPNDFECSSVAACDSGKSPCDLTVNNCNGGACGPSTYAHVVADDDDCCAQTSLLCQDDDETKEMDYSSFCPDTFGNTYKCVEGCKELGKGYNLATLQSKARIYAQYFDDEEISETVRNVHYYYPDNALITVKSETALSASTATATSFEANHRTLAASLGVSGEHPSGMAAGVSADYVQTMDQSISAGNVLYQFSAEISMVELEVGSARQTCSSDFATDAAQLPYSYNFAVYEQFIETFGTHVITKIEVGGTIEQEDYTSYCTIDTSESLSAAIASEGSNKAASFEAAASDDTSSASSSTTTYTRSDMNVKGGASEIFTSSGWDAWAATIYDGENSPSVIRHELEPLYDALPKGLEDLDTIRQNLNQAIAEYLDNALVVTQDSTLGGAARCADVTQNSCGGEDDTTASVSGQAQVRPPRLACVAVVALVVSSAALSW